VETFGALADVGQRACLAQRLTTRNQCYGPATVIAKKQATWGNTPVRKLKKTQFRDTQGNLVKHFQFLVIARLWRFESSHPHQQPGWALCSFRLSWSVRSIVPRTEPRIGCNSLKPVSQLNSPSC